MSTKETGVGNDPLTPPSGAVIGDRYEIVRLISRTAHFNRYEAVDVADRSRLSLKVLAPNISQAGKGWQAIVQTLEAIRGNRHAGLVAVFDLFHDRHGAVVVQEWTCGAPLLDLLRTRPLSPFDVLTILSSLAKGLDYLIERGLPAFAFSLSDLHIHAPHAPEGEWLHLPLNAWDAFELKIDPLPLNTGDSGRAANGFFTSFNAICYQMLGGLPSGGGSRVEFRPLVSLEEAGNRVLRDFIHGASVPKRCREVLVRLAEAENIDCAQIPFLATEERTSEPSAGTGVVVAVTRAESDPHFSDVSEPPGRSRRSIEETERAIAAKESEIADLKVALERHLEETRLVELQSKLEQSFAELEEERARFQEQVAAERDRLREENARLESERVQLGTEKERQDELRSRLEDLRREFEIERARAGREIDGRRAELDRRDEDLQQRLQELDDRESIIKGQQEAMRNQEGILEKRRAVLQVEQERREAELAAHAARVKADHREVEQARRLLDQDRAALDKLQRQVTEEREALTVLDQDLAARHRALTRGEAGVQEERDRLASAQQQWEEQHLAFEQKSSDLERDLAAKDRELEMLRDVENRSVAQQAQMDHLENAKREIESQRAELLQQRQELEQLTEKQSARIEELIGSHERDIGRQRNELAAERSRYAALLLQLEEREDGVRAKAQKQQEAQAQLDQARADLEERAKETIHLRSELQRLESERQRQQRERDEFQQRIETLQNKVDQLEQDRTEAAQDQLEQRSAFAEVEQERRQFEERLQREFDRREELLEQQKAAAERRLQQSLERVEKFKQHKESIRSREAFIRQREAKAQQLEELVERERAARESEAKLRLAAERRSRTLWTKVAIAATVAVLVLGAAGWVWLQFGGGAAMIREKQFLNELEKQADRGEYIELLNRARLFVEDEANKRNDYTLQSGFSAQLRRLLEETIDNIMTRQAADLTRYRAMLERLAADPSLESPRGFIDRLNERIHLDNAEPLKRRLDQLANRERIESSPDPYLKAAAAARYLEAFPEEAGQAAGEFGTIFRQAIEALSPLEEAGADPAVRHLRGVRLDAAPEPGPLLGLLISAIDGRNAAENGLAETEIKSVVKTITGVLEIENALAGAPEGESIADHQTTLRILNLLGGELRDAYRALELHALDAKARSSVETLMAPVIDQYSGSVVRLSRSHAAELIEFLSLIAEVTVDEQILTTLLEDLDYPLPSAMWRGLDYYYRKGDLAMLEKLAQRVVDADLSSIAHGRQMEEWETFCSSVRAWAYRYLAMIRMNRAGELEGDESIRYLRQAEQDLLEGLRLHSGLTMQVLIMYKACVQSLGLHKQAVNGESVEEIQKLARSAYAGLPEERRRAFAGSLDQADVETLQWLIQPLASPEANPWSDFEQRSAGAVYAISNRMPPFDRISGAARDQLIRLFSSGPSRESP